MSTEPSLSPLPEVRTLIDELLGEQRDLTAVERFSRAHDSGALSPARQRHRDLIPLSAPRPGEQYAFDVDLDRCSGCKGCVTACHALNGLDDAESWREIGLLVGEVRKPSLNGIQIVPWQHTVTTACHHCVEPACLLGCPVLAYEKDPGTGIVRHLDDQCIGCSYCILKCPYEVPRFSPSRGIVRKCDMCQGRLADGEAPACVQSCPNEAIRISVVKTEWVSLEWRQRRTGTWLPDSPDPAYTLPTTRYHSHTGSPALRAADHDRLTPAPAHWPLVLMLGLTQAGMGALLAAGLGRLAGAPATAAGRVSVGGLALLIIGLVASVFHLGQPRKAWRAWLGWRTSWMSREVIVLNLALGAAALQTVFLVFPGTGLRLGAELIHVFEPWVLLGMPPTLTLLTLLAVFTQSMVYVDTRRRFWAWAVTGPRFFGTLLISAAMAAVVLAGHGLAVGVAVVGLLLKLAWEIRLLKHADLETETRGPLQRSAQLILGPLRRVYAWRVMAVAAVIGLLLFGVAAGGAVSTVTGLAVVAFLVGELAERWLFFSAVSPDKMPGLP